MVFRNPFREINVGNIFILLGAGLILIQIFAKLSSILFKTADLRLGWAFTLIFGFLAVMIPWLAIVKREGRLERSDIVGIVLIEALLVFILIYGKQFVPEIFSALPTGEGLVKEGLSALQSIIGGEG